MLALIETLLSTIILSIFLFRLVLSKVFQWNEYRAESTL